MGLQRASRGWRSAAFFRKRSAPLVEAAGFSQYYSNFGVWGYFNDSESVNVGWMLYGDPPPDYEEMYGFIRFEEGTASGTTLHVYGSGILAGDRTLDVYTIDEKWEPWPADFRSTLPATTLIGTLDFTAAGCWDTIAISSVNKNGYMFKVQGGDNTMEWYARIFGPLSGFNPCYVD